MTAISPHTLPQLSVALQRAFACGATPFEVIAGAPVERYGARVTFAHAASRETLARQFHLDSHPWGTPRWIGVRVSSSGELHVKPYHDSAMRNAAVELPPTWPRDLVPQMASLDGDTVEVYLSKTKRCRFDAFADQCLAPFNLPAPSFRPQPQPHHDAFGVSLRRDAGRMTAISLYADWRTLPGDDEFEAMWAQGLEATHDRMAYQLALAGVKSLGFRPPSRWHVMVAWTIGVDGSVGRSVSLAVPPI